MPSASSPRSPLDRDAIAELRRQLHDYARRIAESEAIGATLRGRMPDAQNAEMMRINQEIVTSFRRSAELLQTRLKQAESAANTLL